MMTNCAPNNRYYAKKTSTNDSKDNSRHVSSRRSTEMTRNTSNAMQREVPEIGKYHNTDKKSSLVNDTSAAMDTDHPNDEMDSQRDNTDNRSTVERRLNTSRERDTRWLVNPVCCVGVESL